MPIVSMFDALVDCICHLSWKVFSVRFKKLTSDLDRISSGGFADECF